MAKNNPKFVQECPECNQVMSLEVSNQFVEMYCKECGYVEDPRIQFKSDRKNKNRKFKNQNEVPLM